MQKKLKAYRSLLGLTQTQMAEKLGIGIVAYNHKEQGKTDFTQSEITKILEIIKKKVPEVTADEIFFSDEISKI